MMRQLLFFWLLAWSLTPSFAEDKPHSGTRCPEPIYKAKEVSVIAWIDAKKVLDSLSNEADGTVLFQAVFCKTGEVTDIQIIESTEPSLTEKVVHVISQAKFTPAQKDGEIVSVSMRNSIKIDKPTQSKQSKESKGSN